MANKYINASQFGAMREQFRQQGLKVAHCHGVFDLLHPGHIAHLEEAKSFGDILVLSVTATPYVNRGPGRPYFSDELRMKSLAALECVDYVVLAEFPTALEIIDIIRPDYYVKGQEYEVYENDVTQNIDKEVNRVRLHGGDIRFTKGIVFSSTKLLNQNFPVLPPGLKDFMQDFVAKYSFEDIRKIVDRMASLRILVIGDIIIDEYALCGVQGLMSKDRALSVRYDREESYLGGALAIARHLSNFSNNVTMCSIVGNESHIHSQLLNDLSRVMRLDLQFDPNFRTVVKRRFVVRQGIRDQYDKLFSVNYLPEADSEKIVDRKPFYEKLQRSIRDYDMVVVADYGHGLIDEQTMEILQSKAKFLALNCQTNSSNYGTNPITKYCRADTFALDEREMRLAFANGTDKLEELLLRLMKHFNCNMGWLTLGSKGSVCADYSQNLSRTPALTLAVQDTVGAGDAFFSLVSLCAKLEEPAEVGSFLGNIAGALAANILGNSHAIKKEQLLKFASTMLNV